MMMNLLMGASWLHKLFNLQHQWWRLLPLTAIAFISLAPMAAVASAPNKQIHVVTSIRPLALIAEELLAPALAESDHYSLLVTTIVPKNASPHGFSLKPSHLTAVLTAPFVVWLGPSFEPYLQKALLKRSSATAGAVITLEKLPDIALLKARASEEQDLGEAHQGRHDHLHSAGSYDPHLWWSSGNALLVAQVLAEAITGHYPALESLVNKSYQQFQARLHQVRPASLAAGKRKPFLTYHDGLLYLEQELQIVSHRRIASSPDEKPSLKGLLALSAWIKQARVTCIILEPGVNKKFLRKLTATSPMREIIIDPLGWDAASYSNMWKQGAAKLAACGMR